MRCLRTATEHTDLVTSDSGPYFKETQENSMFKNKIKKFNPQNPVNNHTIVSYNVQGYSIRLPTQQKYTPTIEAMTKLFADMNEQVRVVLNVNSTDSQLNLFRHGWPVPWVRVAGVSMVKW